MRQPRDEPPPSCLLLVPGGKLEIWGCNSGIAHWEYSDEDAAGNPVYDLNAPASTTVGGR